MFLHCVVKKILKAGDRELSGPRRDNDTSNQRITDDQSTPAILSFTESDDCTEDACMTFLHESV